MGFFHDVVPGLCINSAVDATVVHHNEYYRELIPAVIARQSLSKHDTMRYDTK